jgi:hypothetical protein
MTLQVTSTLESDIDRLMEIQFSAFDNDPYHEALYPGATLTPPAPSPESVSSKSGMKIPLCTSSNALI